MDRRAFSAALVSVLLTCGCGVSSALAKAGKDGCRMAAAADPEIDTRERLSSGNLFWDSDCKIMHSEIAKEAGVKPGFCFYDDSDGANALALPDALFPQEPDGTIMFGVTPSWTARCHRQPPILFSRSLPSSWRTSSAISFNTGAGCRPTGLGKWSRMPIFWQAFSWARS